MTKIWRMMVLTNKYEETQKFKEAIRKIRGDFNPETVLELIMNYYFISGFSISKEEALELIKEALSE